MEGEEVFAGRYRSDEEITSWEVPILSATFAQRSVGPASPIVRRSSESGARSGRSEAALEFAIQSPPPDLSELIEHQWAEVA